RRALRARRGTRGARAGGRLRRGDGGAAAARCVAATGAEATRGLPAAARGAHGRHRISGDVRERRAARARGDAAAYRPRARRRLTMAFEALEGFPALAESRDRLLAIVSKDHVATADVVSAVESDVALIIAVLRLANRVQDGRGRVDTVVGAVERLSARTVQAVANRMRTFDFFERASVWDAAPERFRLHALATQHAADRVAAE